MLAQGVNLKGQVRRWPPGTIGGENQGQQANACEGQQPWPPAELCWHGLLELLLWRGARIKGAGRLQLESPVNEIEQLERKHGGGAVEVRGGITRGAQ